ncbi:MAG TPA: class I SAM-dependent methyltransferase [Actinomycetota bacterium]|nr:class I SAM-dependent methyltransferase [Actinomycetota bacterium]
MKEHPVFARLWDTVVRLAGEPEQRHRDEMVRGLRGLVLELGAGTGLNLFRYVPEARVVAVEPEPTMARAAAGRAREAKADAAVLRGVAEDLPFPDRTFDAVVACYVLCSVADPRRAISELRRVLSPGGEIRVYEHVRSAHPRWARVQDAITPVWRRFGCNCHPNRDTAALLEAAGFDVDVRRFSFGPPAPVRPHILGVAR